MGPVSLETRFTDGALLLRGSQKASAKQGLRQMALGFGRISFWRLLKFFKKRVDGVGVALYKPPSAPNDSSQRIVLLQVNMTERDTQAADCCLYLCRTNFKKFTLKYHFQDNTPKFLCASRN